MNPEGDIVLGYADPLEDAPKEIRINEFSKAKPFQFSRIGGAPV